MINHKCQNWQILKRSSLFLVQICTLKLLFCQLLHHFYKDRLWFYHHICHVLKLCWGYKEETMNVMTILLWINNHANLLSWRVIIHFNPGKDTLITSWSHESLASALQENIFKQQCQWQCNAGLEIVVLTFSLNIDVLVDTLIL